MAYFLVYELFWGMKYFLGYEIFFRVCNIFGVLTILGYEIFFGVCNIFWSMKYFFGNAFLGEGTFFIRGQGSRLLLDNTCMAIWKMC